MKATSASANKMIRKLTEDKEFWLNKERSSCVYTVATEEEAVIPDYSYTEVSRKIAEIDERIASVKAELEECRKDRVEKARAVPDPKFLLYYERLRTKRWPVVAPLTRDCVCDGCHLVQPPSVGQLVDANARNGAEGKPQSIVACTMCGRILYRDA